MNKSSLDRGFGRCIVLRKYGTTMKKYKNRTTDRVVRPLIQPGQVSLHTPLARHQFHRLLACLLVR